MTIFSYIILISSALLCLLILLQTRGASVGSGFGGSAEVESVRRGADKTLHQITIILVIVFAASIILSIIS